MCDEQMTKHPHCACHTDAPLRGLLHVAILDLIKDKSAHGGEIYKNLKEKHEIDAPRGIIYALLRRLEGHSLVVSDWDIRETGPARRVYYITDDGLKYLKSFLERLKRASRMIHILLEQNS
jgi:DNA-binding PadR family transcriptional regulator